MSCPPEQQLLLLKGVSDQQISQNTFVYLYKVFSYFHKSCSVSINAVEHNPCGVSLFFSSNSEFAHRKASNLTCLISSVINWHFHEIHFSLFQNCNCAMGCIKPFLTEAYGGNKSRERSYFCCCSKEKWWKLVSGVCVVWPGKSRDASLTAPSLCRKTMLFPIETFVASDTVWVCCVFVCECL